MTHGQCDARSMVTFPAAEHHRPLTGTKLYCLVNNLPKVAVHRAGVEPAISWFGTLPLHHQTALFGSIRTGKQIFRNAWTNAHSLSRTDNIDYRYQRRGQKLLDIAVITWQICAGAGELARWLLPCDSERLKWIGCSVDPRLVGGLACCIYVYKKNKVTK